MESSVPTPETPATQEPAIEILETAQRREKIYLRENGVVSTYELVELSGAARDEWLNGMHKRIATAPDGKAKGINDYKDLQVSLISKCLVDPRGLLVSPATLRGWAASTQKVLFEKCQKLCGLGDDAEETAKND